MVNLIINMTGINKNMVNIIINMTGINKNMVNLIINKQKLVRLINIKTYREEIKPKINVKYLCIYKLIIEALK